MIHDSIAEVFTKNNRRTPVVEDLQRQATNMLDNSPRLGAHMIQRVCAVSTVQPHLQQDYIDFIVEDMKPSERVETFIRACATTLSDPPQSHVTDAMNLITSAGQLLQAVPEHPDIHLLISADVHTIVNNIALSTAGSMVYQTTLDDPERDTYVRSVIDHLTQQNQSLAVMANIMQAVAHMKNWRTTAPAIRDIANISLATDLKLANTNYFRQRRTTPQTPQEFATICIQRSVARQCESIMLDNLSTNGDARITAIAYWHEVEANLPTLQSYWPS